MASTEIHDITDYNYSGSKLKYFCHNWISGYFPEPERERTGFCMFSLTFQCKYQSKHVQPIFENPTPDKPITENSHIRNLYLMSMPSGGEQNEQEKCYSELLS